MSDKAAAAKELGSKLSLHRSWQGEHEEGLPQGGLLSYSALSKAGPFGLPMG